MCVLTSSARRVRLSSSSTVRVTALMVMVHPTRRSGAGEDRLFRVLRPSANRIVRGRRSVMAHTISLDGSSIQRYEHCRTDAGPENAVAAVVLAADALAGLHVHGVGNSDGSGCQAAGEGGKTGSKGPLAHGCSPRDNYTWRPFSDDRFPENAGLSRCCSQIHQAVPCGDEAAPLQLLIRSSLGRCGMLA